MRLVVDNYQYQNHPMIKNVNIDGESFIGVRIGKNFICFNEKDNHLKSIKCVDRDLPRITLIKDALYDGVALGKIKDYVVAIVYANRIGLPTKMRSGVYICLVKDGCILYQVSIASKNIKEFEFDINTIRVDLDNKIELIDELLKYTTVKNIERNRSDLYALLDRVKNRAASKEAAKDTEGIPSLEENNTFDNAEFDNVEFTQDELEIDNYRKKKHSKTEELELL